MGPLIAETPRVQLHRCTPDDAEALARIGTREVIRFLDGNPWTVATATALIALWAEIEQRLGITTWAVRWRPTGELIGTCGFAGTNAPWLRSDFVIEIGWTFAQPWWGQGLATEAAHAALRVGLARYPRQRIISKCHADNTASERVMHRIGMRRVGVVRARPTAPAVICRFP